MPRWGSIMRFWSAMLLALVFGPFALLPVSTAFTQTTEPCAAYDKPVSDRMQSAQIDAAALRERLFDALKGASDEREGRLIENEIWRFFLARAPDATTRGLVEEAMEKRSIYDFARARELLDQAVERAPDYAEAYNQRSFVLYMQEDYDGALQDVDKAIELEPKHFAAMAGRAMILMRQGRFGLAQDQLREAVEIHPFLKERAMIVPKPDDDTDEPVPDMGGVEL